MYISCPCWRFNGDSFSQLSTIRANMVAKQTHLCLVPAEAHSMFSPCLPVGRFIHSSSWAPEPRDWRRASFTASEREERLLHASLDLFSLANFPPLLAVLYMSGPLRVPWRLSLFRSAFLSNAILSHRCPFTLQSTQFPLQTITARPHPILQYEFACMGCDLALVQWARLQQLGDKNCIW